MPLVVVSALVTAWSLVPPYPGQPSKQEFERQENAQWAGDHSCQAQELAHISRAILKQQRADQCAQDREREREEREERWQAIRTAIATQQAATMGWRQVVVGAIDSAILLLALGASVLAGVAATNAANAANDTLEHERQAVIDNRATERRRERAYVFIGIAEHPEQYGFVLMPPYGAVITLNLSNSGKTLGIVDTVTLLGFHNRPDGRPTAPQPIRPPQVIRFDTVWPAGEARALAQLRQFISGNGPPLFLGVAVVYTDIFDQRHFSRFLFYIDVRSQVAFNVLDIPYWSDWS
jgi:hypothetical protein